MITKIDISPTVFKMGFPFLTRRLETFSNLSDSIAYCIDNPDDGKEIDNLNAWLASYFLFDTPDVTRFFKYPISTFTQFKLSKDFDINSNLLPPLVYSIVSAYILFGAIKRAIPASGLTIETTENTPIGAIVDAVAGGMEGLEALDIVAINNERGLNKKAFMAKENLLLGLQAIRDRYLDLFKDDPQVFEESIAKEIFQAYRDSLMGMGLKGDFNHSFWTQKFTELIEKANQHTKDNGKYGKSFDFLCYFFYLSDNFATHTFFHHPDDVFEDLNKIIKNDGSVFDVIEAFMKRSMFFFKDPLSRSAEDLKRQHNLIEFKFLRKSFFAKPKASASDFEKEKYNISGNLSGSTLSVDFGEGLDMSSLNKFSEDLTSDDAGVVGLINMDPVLSPHLTTKEVSLKPKIAIGASIIASMALLYWMHRSKRKKIFRGK